MATRYGRWAAMAAVSAVVLSAGAAAPEDRATAAATAPTGTESALGPLYLAVVAGAVLRAQLPAAAAPAEPAPGALSAEEIERARGLLPAGSRGIPGPVLAGYRRAAEITAADDPGCHLGWELLAGIGRIESGHARGGRVDATGTTRGRILGPRLDGTLPGTAVIGDSDGGALDGDPVFDRAAGPMQFLPGTWRGFGADGNGDEAADPHNVHDAALAAAHYLCAGGGDLRDPRAVSAALFRYNRSVAYGLDVLAWAEAYRTGGTPVPGHPGRVPPAPSAPAPPAAGTLLAGPAASPPAPPAGPPPPAPAAGPAAPPPAPPAGPAAPPPAPPAGSPPAAEEAPPPPAPASPEGPAAAPGGRAEGGRDAEGPTAPPGTAPPPSPAPAPPGGQTAEPEPTAPPGGAPPEPTAPPGAPPPAPAAPSGSPEAPLAAPSCPAEPVVLEPAATSALPDGAGLLLRFALPALPEGCGVAASTLRFEPGEAVAGHPLAAQRVAGPWAEGAASDPGSAGPAVVAEPGPGPRSWPVTELVAALYRGPDHGLSVRPAGDAPPGAWTPAGTPVLTLTFG